MIAYYKSRSRLALLQICNFLERRVLAERLPEAGSVCHQRQAYSRSGYFTCFRERADGLSRCNPTDRILSAGLPETGFACRYIGSQSTDSLA